MKRLRRSLLTQLLVQGGFVILVLISAYMITTQYVRRNDRQRIMELNEQMLHQIQDEADSFYDFMNHVATTLVYSPTMYGYFAMDPVDRIVSAQDISEVYLNTVLLEDNIAGLYLYDSDMNRLSSMGESVSGEEERLLVQTDEMDFGDVFSMGTSEAARYVMYFPVYDLEKANYGHRMAMCVFLMKTDNFDDMLLDSPVTESAQMYIVDGNGNIVASLDGKKADVLEASMLEDSAEYEVEVRALKMEGWRVISRIPRAELERTSNQLDGLILGTYILAAGTLMLMVYSSYLNVVKPLNQIDLFIRHVVEEPKKRMETDREDEIGTVIKSLNRMLDEKARMDGEMEASRQKLYEMELAGKQLQLLAYQNQINPHFLYNTLDCIRAMALYYDADEIAEITMALSRVFRYSIKGEHVVTLEEEISYIREYAKIIEYRFMDRIRVEICLAKEAAECRIIKLVLQPLVENAVFHGLEKTIEGGTVWVNATLTKDRFLCLTVEDDGCGMPEDRLREIQEMLESGKSTKGIGMANIYQRLRLFYADAMRFQVESEQGKGTKITILIPDHVESGEEKDV